MISIQIDNREKAIINLKEKIEHEIEVAQLDLGDFQILHNEEIRYIIERKTLEDLQSSIIDNRYKEQKQRTLSYCSSSSCNYIYIIEGEKSISGLSSSSVGAILNSTFRDEIPVLFSTSPIETCFILKNILDRMKANPEKYLKKPKTDYNEIIIKQRKKDNIDLNVVLLMQLCSIPGISSTKAKQIVETKGAKNIFDLCTKMSKQSPDDFFREIKGIGKKLSQSIYVFCGINIG